MNTREFYRNHAKQRYGITPGDAYELERALKVHANFPESSGSGPGGGVEATAFTISFFTIGCLLGGVKKDLGERVWTFWNLSREGSSLCGYGDVQLTMARDGLTGEHLFGDAVYAVIANPTLAARVVGIGVSRTAPEAWITYRDGDGVQISRFSAHGTSNDREEREHSGVLNLTATIGGKALQEIARDTTKDTEEESDTKTHTTFVADA